MTRIVIAAPIRPSESSGNSVTATRWAGHLRRLGHDVQVVAIDEDEPDIPADLAAVLRSADVLIVLHARRSGPVIGWWTTHRSTDPIVVGLVGTDLYVDMPDDAATMASVDRADALIVLQTEAVERLRGFDSRWADKALVIYQSVEQALPTRAPIEDEFRVVVLAHLREVKDPLLSARAARLLPPESRVVVQHAGRAFSEQWEQLARDESATNHRYVWHEELNPAAALELLASATVLACTSLSEGGANVVTEALALGIPVIGTRVDGNVGMLGRDHPGLFAVGDTAALAVLLDSLENDAAALADLTARSAERSTITRPEAEQAAFAELFARLD